MNAKHQPVEKLRRMRRIYWSLSCLMLVSEKVLCLYIQQLPSMTSQKSIVCCDGHNVLPVLYTKLGYFLIGSWNIFSNCLDDIRTDSPWILLQEEGIDFLSHVCYLIWRLSKHLHSSTRDLRLPTAVTMSFYHWWWVLSRNKRIKSAHVCQFFICCWQRKYLVTQKIYAQQSTTHTYAYIKFSWRQPTDIHLKVF